MCTCNQADGDKTCPLHSGVAAPLEPTAEESFTRWVEENKFTVIPDETPHRQWQLIFADFHAAAVSKNRTRETEWWVAKWNKAMNGKESAEARILELESEITALRETKI